MSGREVVPIDEISVSAELTERGIKAGARSRALSALDRLVGSTIDLAGAPIEGLRDRMRARNDARAALIQAQGDAEVRRLGLGESGDAVVAALTIDEMRKAENREAVAIEFLEQLQAAQGPAEDISQPIDPDWMNVFSAHAENASSDRLRTLWASILAGQVRRPGAYSLSTLRFVSELDQDIATLFQKHLGSIIFDQFLLKPKDLKGDLLIDLTFLEEVGLLSEVNGSLGLPARNSTDGFWYHAQGSLLLKLKLTGDARISVIKLTRVGREIASIIPRRTDEDCLTDVFHHLEDKVSEADLAIITERLPDNQVRHVPLRKLKG